MRSLFRAERAQRHWYMLGSLGSFFVTRFLFLWLALVLLVFVLQGGVGSLVWLFHLAASKAWAWICPSCGYPWVSTSANVTQVAAYLSGQLWPALASALLWSSFLTGVCLVGFLAWARRPEPEEVTLRGATIGSVKELNRRTGGGGIVVCGVRIGEGREHGHFALSGASGSGKSTVVRGLLRQIQARNETAVVVDIEGEYVSQFYDEARGDIVLSPLDDRFPGWSPWAEIAEPGDGETFAAAFIPDAPPEKMQGTDTYYRGASRDVLLSLMVKVQPQTARELLKVLQLPAATLAKGLAGTPGHAHLVARTAGNVVSGVSSAVQSWRYLPPVIGPGWSARAWAEHRQGWIFLTAHPSQRRALLPLLSAWLSLLTGRLLATELDGGHGTVWVVADELDRLGRQSPVEEIATMGRKRGLALVLAFQSHSQLTARYGVNGAATILSNPATKLLLATGEPTGARWAADVIGESEKERAQHSESAGAWAGSDRQVRAKVRRTDRAVLPSEIQHLGNYEGYLLVCGCGIARVTVPYDPAEQHVPAFIPREGFTMPAPPVVVSIEQKRSRRG